MPRNTPHPIKLGSVIQAYVGTLSKHSESEIDKRATASLDNIIKRMQDHQWELLTWKQITGQR
jgi:hypothetical protein